METNFSAPLGRVAGRDVPVAPLPMPGEGGAVDSGATPVVPLPDVGEGGPVGGGQTPGGMLPDFGEGGPVGGGSQTPGGMLPDFGEGGPVGGGSQTPGGMLPDFGEGGPVADGSQTPGNMLPDFGEGGPVANPSPSPSFAYVRFLNAVTDGVPLRVSLGNRLLATNLAPGSLTGYYTVSAGFRNLALADARFPWTVLFRSAVPFSNREIVTLAVVRSGAGVDLVRVDDRPCFSRGTNRSCVRTANLMYNSPGLDVILTDGRVVFSDVRFKEVTTFRRARAGQYDMYIAQTPYVLPLDYTDIETVEDMPVVIPDYFLPGYGAVEPLASVFLDARPGAMVTIYLMGNWNRSHNVRVRVVQNF